MIELIKFGTPTCGKCMMQGKAIHDAKKVIDFNYQDADLTAMSDNVLAIYNIGQTIPVVIFFKDGKEVHRFTTSKEKPILTKNDILGILNDIINSD